MGSMLASNIVGHGLQQVKQKTIKLVVAASLLSKQHRGAITKTCWLRIRIMLPSGAT